MLTTRVIPCLLLCGGGLVKTVKFGKQRYIGDPINAVRVLNDKEVDELMFLDIDATRSGAGPNFELLADIASEAFMPFGYGGGITNLSQVKHLFRLGIEKVVINTAAVRTPSLVTEIASFAGSSSVVVSMDVRRNFLGKYSVCIDNGREALRSDPITHALDMEKHGAGEILVNSIDRDGTYAGYDLELIQRVSAAVSVPVISSGGASCLQDFRDAVRSGASAVAAGSLFVFHGKHRAVLITYPDYGTLLQLFEQPSSKPSIV